MLVRPGVPGGYLTRIVSGLFANITVGWKSLPETNPQLIWPIFKLRGKLSDVYTRPAVQSILSRVNIDHMLILFRNCEVIFAHFLSSKSFQRKEKYYYNERKLVSKFTPPLRLSKSKIGSWIQSHNTF